MFYALCSFFAFAFCFLPFALYSLAFGKHSIKMSGIVDAQDPPFIAVSYNLDERAIIEP